MTIQVTMLVVRKAQEITVLAVRGFLRLACAVILSVMLSAVQSAEPPADTPSTSVLEDVYQDFPFGPAEARRRQEDAAARMGVPVESSLALGDGLMMEMVLILPGKFIMGDSKPVSLWGGLGVVLLAGLATLILIVNQAVRARRRGRKFQFSLRWLIGLTLLLGMVLYAVVSLERSTGTWRSYDFCESPAHEVTIRTPYYMGRFEVTQEQYEKVMGVNPSEFKGARNPVNVVSWNEAQEFCRKISQQTRRVVRLPTESEWEYACRAGRQSKYQSGDSPAGFDLVAWFSENSNRTTHPVGQKQPNAFGLYDMYGNVAEWCEDDWHEDYVGAPQDGSAWVDTPRSAERVLRGGSWYYTASHCTATHRNNLHYPPELGSLYFGFRVVVEIPPLKL